MVPCVEALATLAVDPNTAVRAAARRIVSSAVAAGTKLPEGSCKPSAAHGNSSTGSSDASLLNLDDPDSNVHCRSDGSNTAVNCNGLSGKLHNEVYNEEGHRYHLTKQMNSNHVDSKEYVSNYNLNNSLVENLQLEHANNSHIHSQCCKDASHDVTGGEKISVADFDGQKGFELGEVCCGSGGEWPASVQYALQERFCQAIKQLPTLAMASGKCHCLLALLLGEIVVFLECSLCSSLALVGH